MGIHDLWLFALAGFLLNITPGPDMALVLARSAQYGPRAGMVAALGVGVGGFVHITAAALGVSAILMASASAFMLLKWIGAAYLVYIGLQTLWGSFKCSPSTSNATVSRHESLRSVFVQGVLTNALNPKVALFFLAFVPQFIDADAPSKVTAFIFLGLLFDASGTGCNLLVAWWAGRLATSSRFARMRVWLARAIGTVFVGVGVRMAFLERA
jgi:threonine/homoserine/homoserine lactone efflux protein